MAWLPVISAPWVMSLQPTVILAVVTSLCSTEPG